MHDRSRSQEDTRRQQWLDQMMKELNTAGMVHSRDMTALELPRNDHYDEDRIGLGVASNGAQEGTVFLCDPEQPETVYRLCRKDVFVR
ncbi:hypothetical protein chiPu_0014915 [Chiloscyllium punctatum]|uniref:Uncharacterized protein n=1 Tax=Chiloscyllium punctatum TaxID=137246 RepID=A0A401T1B6_CHIPU|nr:hypothetical protein [Chiloscyllium punctatum]